jgi:hypothetical protein
VSSRKLRQAYDPDLQIIVTAEEAAKNDGYEFKHFECVVCGQELILAAADSAKISVHFRHQRGNNNVNCENYIGQIHDDAYSNKRETLEFYYDHARKMFCLSISLSEDKLEFYEQNNVEFELRTRKNSDPLFVVKVNRTFFIPDSINLFPIEKFSYVYYVSNSLDQNARRYSLFNKNDGPIFLKILGNEEEFKAKHVKGNALYMNTKYLMVLPFVNKQIEKILHDIDVEKIFEFTTMNIKFQGIIFRISHITPLLNSLFKTWGYQILPDEYLAVLWPPTYNLNHRSVVRSDYIYIYTSFKLNPKGNINLPREQIKILTDNISKINLTKRTIISNRNAELVINVGKSTIEQTEFEKIIPFSIELAVFEVPDEDELTYFLFNKYGVTQLAKGQTIFLTPDSEIFGYKKSYPTVKIIPLRHREKHKKHLLEDILAHYKRTELFDSSKFSLTILDDATIRYLRKCEKDGKINSVVRSYIEEGRL